MDKFDLKKYSIFMLAFLCQFSFGMKRQREDKEQIVQVNRKSVQKQMSKEVLDKFIKNSFEDSLSPTKIVTFKSDFAISDAYTKIDQLKYAVIVNGKYGYIDQIQKKRYDILCKTSESFVKKLFADELEMMHDLLYKNENDAIKTLIQFYKVDTASNQWQTKMLELEERIKFNALSMQYPRNDTSWDSSVPGNFVTMLIAVMEENGLNPATINVKKLDPQRSQAANASMIEPRPVLLNMNKVMIIKNGTVRQKIKSFDYANGVPGCVFFNESLAYQTDESLRHTALHEITHFLEAHGETLLCLLNIIAYSRNISYKEIMESCELADVILAQETIADLLSVIQNPDLARSILNSQVFYPNSYGFLKTIKTYLEVLDYFEQQKPNQKILQ